MSRWWATMAQVYVVLFVSFAGFGYLFGGWVFGAGAVVAALGLVLALVKLQGACRAEDHMRAVRTLLLGQERSR